MARSVAVSDREQWAMDVATRAGLHGEVQYTMAGDTIVIALVDGEGGMQVLDCMVRKSWEIDLGES